MYHSTFHHHRAIAGIATLLFSMSGLSQIRAIAQRRSTELEITDPTRSDRVQRILAAASSQRQAKLARRAARHYASNATTPQ